MRKNLFSTTVLVCLFTAGVAHAKNASTIYTPQRVANARSNVKAYDWARHERDTIVATANRWAALSDEQIWAWPVEQTVPRGIYVHPTQGCPIHGKQLIEKHGVYGWKVDPINHPWKVQCPIGGERWPTNDFKRFYASGKDGANVFQYARADRSLLYSTDPARSKGVDDGRGYVDDAGNRYAFIAYYVHWGVWQDIGRSWTRALTALSEAYVLTGDAKYARKTAILLSRIADLLPTMNTATWSAQGFAQGDGKSGVGLALGSIWDADVASSISRAYDAVFPALASDPGLLSFLQAKASKHGLTRVDTPARLRSHIEANALEVLLPAIQQRRIRANEGVHQKAYAEAALALDDPTATPRWLDWLAEPGDKNSGGGHLPSILVDMVSRDGATDEASAGYNYVWVEALEPLAELLEDSPYAAHSPSRYPNFRNLLSFPFWMQLTPDYYPHIGDENKTGNPGRAPGNDPNRYASDFLRYGHPELAQMAYVLNGNRSEGLHGGIFDPGADETARAIEGVIGEYGKPTTGSILLAGYGLAALRGTAGGRPSAVWQFSGPMGKHGHSDRLNLGMIAHGLNLMPDLGYPDFPTVDSPLFWGWHNNTVAHNTVVVDARRQHKTPVGETLAFLPSYRVQVVETEGKGVYPQTQMYRRSLIRVATRHSFYLVDIFRVAGGKDHLYSLHAGAGAIAAEGLNLAPRSGTYAGKDIAFGKFYDGVCCATYTGSGFQFLDEVSTDDAPPTQFVAEWSLTDHWGALDSPQDTRLRVWSVGDAAHSVSFASGHPPANKPGNPRRLRYLLERRRAAEALQTSFVHVFDPGVGPRQVRSVERFTPQPATDAAGFARIGLRITLEDGRVDTVIHAVEPETVEGDGIEFSGRGAVVSHRDDAFESAYLIAGTELRVGGETKVVAPGIWSGRILAVDESAAEDVRLVVDTAPPAAEWAGRYLKVHNPAGHNPFYRIEKVVVRETTATIHIGRVNLVRGHQNPLAYEQGFSLDVAKGDAFEVQSDAVFPPPPVFEQEEMLTDSLPETLPAPERPTWRIAGCASASRGGAALWLLLPVVYLRLRRMRKTRPAA